MSSRDPAQPCHIGVIDQAGLFPNETRAWTPLSNQQPSSRRSSERRHASAAPATGVARPAAAGRSIPPTSRIPALYINRELSWLEFNERVLAQARDTSASAARARQVPGDHRHQPRRVLHDPRRDDAEEAARGNRGRRAGRLQHRAAARRDARRARGGCCWIRRRSGTSCGRCWRPNTSRSSSRTSGRRRSANS